MGYLMAKQKQKKSANKPSRQKDSVFAEAWENMSDDMSRFLPDFIVNKMQGGKNKLWVMIAITVVELLVLGIIGKLLYDWFTG